MIETSRRDSWIMAAEQPKATVLNDGMRHVFTPQGPGIIWPYTPFAEQVKRGRIAVRLDQAVHPSGRLVEYFDPLEVKEAYQG